jgi:hypothetical protein
MALTTHPKNRHVCLSCGRNEEDVPLVMLRFASNELNICPQCLPVLIHHPDRLAERLEALGATKRDRAR